MGLMLENGFDGYIPDILQAEEMYCKAYKLKNVDAAFNLGLLYTNYSQFSVEPQNAIKLVYESAVKGNKSAQSYLISLGYANNETEFIENVSPEFLDDYEEQEEDEENVNDNKIVEENFDEQDDLSDENIPEMKKTLPANQHTLQRKNMERFSDVPAKAQREKQRTRCITAMS
uniref:Uncharacterized protein n=1 Tax=Euplotes harpa TaxID=151035 RepID=A0A7S3NBB7_9SPIT|mmetsp:Transcript_4277/g.5188  ORF Transcript_4277/g.5188 Transcript_4277/m.5188 type:complete len:173 (+) Transcript_4277:139-657(+)